MKFAKHLKTPILKNISKRLLVEVFYKKAFYNIHRTKVASDKCSVKKVLLGVDRDVKLTCAYID